jgi:predicted nucleotidyltransferase component of viral defense system
MEVHKMDIKKTVECFHLLFLLFISRKIDRRYYILKGGCNLRFFFNSPRYSEDIDFDLHGIPVRIFQEQVGMILKSRTFKETLLAKGITIGHITEHKQTETTQRWKLGIISKQVQMPTKIEFSRRSQKEGLGRFESVNSALLKKHELPPVLVNHYTAGEAFMQKISATASRKFPQARDIFDMYLLITTGDFAPSFKSADKDMLSRAKNNIFSIDYNTFKSHVVSYLEADDRDLYASEETWDAIRLEITEFLEGAG